MDDSVFTATSLSFQTILTREGTPGRHEPSDLVCSTEPPPYRKKFILTLNTKVF